MIAQKAKYFIRAAMTVGVLAFPVSAQAVVVDVTLSASGQFNSTDPIQFSITGGFSFDSDLPGATNDLSQVGILDPGIFDFAFFFTGFGDFAFTDPTLIASGSEGSFDLSSEGNFSDITNSAICVEDSPGNGVCGGRGNPAAILLLGSSSVSSSILFSPPLVRARFIPNTTEYTVSYRDVAAVPLPASGLFLLGAFACAALIRHRKQT